MRLIDADALYEALVYDEAKTYIIYKGEYVATWRIADAINDAPTIDAEPVRHGRWEYVRTSNGGRLQCMECKHYIDVGNDKNYCPNCGAKMDLEVQDAKERPDA